MPEARAEIVVDRPPDEVWRVMSEDAGHPEAGYEIVERDAGRSISFRGGEGPLRISGRYELAPSGAGTRIASVFAVDAPWWLRWVMRRAHAFEDLPKRQREALDDLKRRLETR